MPIYRPSRYGDPRREASGDLPEWGRDAPDAPASPADAPAPPPEPQIRFTGATGGPTRPGRGFWDGLLPEGADLVDPSGRLAARVDRGQRGHRREAQFGGGGFGGMFGGVGSDSMQTYMRPYQPDVDSPDRLSYPQTSKQANYFWRLFYKLDPVVGTCIDMLCCPAGELVTLADGDLAPIEDVTPGEWIRGADGLPQQVLRAGGRHHAGDMFTVTPRGMLSVSVTLNHRILRVPHVVARKRSDDTTYGPSESDPAFVEVERLAVRDYLVVPKAPVPDACTLQVDLLDYLEDSRSVHENYTVTDDVIASVQNPSAVLRRKLEVSEALCWLMGLYAAEGSSTRHNATFTIDAAEEDLIERLVGTCVEVFGVDPMLSHETEQNGVNVVLCRRAIARLMDAHCGKGARSKQVPSFVREGPLAWRKAFVQGYFEGDGWRQRNALAAWTSSRTLAQQLQQVCLDVGAWMSIRHAPVHGGYGGTSDGYALSMRADRMGLPCEPKMVDRPFAHDREDHWLVPIKSITREHYEGPVYDLKTEQEAFCAGGGFVIHNSSMCFSGFEVVGQGVDGEVKERIETMLDKTRLFGMLPYFLREWLVIGEVCPHLGYDTEEGIWTSLGFHDPDHVEVYHAPQFGMDDPACYLVPSPDVREQLMSQHPRMIAFRDSMPPEVLSAIMTNRPLELEDTNFTFIARKLHPYHKRGTSSMSRLWRIFMLEDGYASASISVVRRAACFKAGAPVQTEAGVVPIEEVQTGHRVLSGQGRFQTVTAAWAELPDDEGLVDIEVQGTPTLTCTPSHRFPVWRSPATGADWDPVQKVPARELRRGDYLMIPRRFEPWKGSLPPLEAARLLGYGLAEGHLRDSGEVTLTFGIHEETTWVLDMWRLAEALDLATVSTRQGNRIQVRFSRALTHGQDWSAWLLEMGGRLSHALRLTEEVMRWPLGHKEELLRGLYRKDGHIQWAPDGSMQATLTTTSSALATQVRTLLAQLGWVGGVSRAEKGRDVYRVTSGGASGRALAELVWEEAVAPGKKADERCWIDEDHLYVPVTEVTHRPEARETTYNLSVDGDESYTVYGLATLNSPVKVVKMGDHATGYIPDDAKMMDMEAKLAQAELDSQGWIVTSYAAQADYWGMPDRVLNLRDHQDFIDQAKFANYGVSRGLLQNEVAYAAAASGLNAMLQRLRSYRDMFEQTWILPKCINLLIEMNEWMLPSEATTASIRSGAGPAIIVRRTAREAKDPAGRGPRLIRAQLQWDRPLDPHVDSARLGAIQQLQGMGLRFSDQTLFALGGLDWEEETQQRIQEARRKRELIEANPDVAVAPGMAPQQDAGAGGVGGGMLGGDLGGGDLGGGDLGEDLGGGDFGEDLGGGDFEAPGPAPAPAALGGNNLLSDSRGHSQEAEAETGTETPGGGSTPAERARGVPEFVHALRRGFDEGDWAPAREGRAGGLGERLYDTLQAGKLHAPKAASSTEAWPDVRAWLLDEGVPVAWVAEAERQVRRSGAALRDAGLEARLDREMARFEAMLRRDGHL